MRDHSSERSTSRGHRRIGELSDVEAVEVDELPDHNIEQHTRELDDEERELWRQLRRKRDFEDRVAEKRAQLTELRDRRRNVSAACAEASVSIARLSSEAVFVVEQDREVAHDIAVLRESNRILRGAMTRENPPPPAAGPQDPRDVLANERARKVTVQAQHEQIEHLRAHLERMQAEKIGLQQRQRVLFEKQHAAEQDRNLLLSSLQEDRRGINDLRADRLGLWEERIAMEREMAKLVKDAYTGLPMGQPASTALAGDGREVGWDRGVRPPTSQNAPTAFSSPDELDSGAPRPHWTRFGTGDVGAPSSASGTAEPAGDNIVEWAPRMREVGARGV